MVKNLPANAEVTDVPLTAQWGKSSGGGNGNLLQYSCLGNLDRGAGWAVMQDTTEVI